MKEIPNKVKYDMFPFVARNANRIPRRPETWMPLISSMAHHLPPEEDEHSYREVVILNTYSIFDMMWSKRWDNIIKDDEVLMLDMSPEHFHVRNPKGLELLNRIYYLIEEIGIDAGNIIIVSSSIQLEEEYNQWCDDNSKTERVHIMAHQCFECLHRIYVDSENLLDDPKVVSGGGGTKEFEYLFLNRSTRIHRSTGLLYLEYHNLIEKGIISFLPGNIAGKEVLAHGEGISHIEDQEERKAFAMLIVSIREFNSFAARSTMDVTKLRLVADRTAARLPLSADVSPDIQQIIGKRNTSGYNAEIYDKTKFSIISETVYDRSNQPVTFLTEKTWVAIINRHPFIYIALPNTLETLKFLGYKTFSPYINEEYDTITDPIERMECLMAEINRICNLCDEESDFLFKQLETITEYNFNHFFSTTRRNENLILYNQLKDILRK